MARHGVDENWAAGEAYESYVGRWSRLVGRAFIDWLAEPPDLRWLDVGCGTGALSQVVLEHGLASRVVGVDSSDGMLAYARSKEPHPAVTFRPGAAGSLPVDDDAFDVAVSGLMLNLLPEPARGVAEMRRAVVPGGTVAAYVWDYADEMQLMRRFWDAACALVPAARAHDHAQLFPLAAPEPLTALFQGAGLDDVETRAIDVDTIFDDFEDYWTPFLSGAGPAQDYCLSLDDDARGDLRERLRDTLPSAPDGRIHLIARAFAVRGAVPE